MSIYINHNNGTVYEGCTVTVHNGQITHMERKEQPAEDIQPIDTSFFCTDRFTPDIIEKNIRQAVELASSKADACRRLMALETQGYLVLSNVKDERKAELVNPFVMPKYTLTGEDFKKARNR